jgi:hypothetical protein
MISHRKCCIWVFALTLCGGLVPSVSRAGTVSYQVINDANIASFFPAGLTFTTILDAGGAFGQPGPTINGYAFHTLSAVDANNTSSGQPAVNNFNYDASNAPPGAGSAFGPGGSGTYPPDGISVGGFLGRLLSDFIFDNGVNVVGDSQTYKLSGLTVGTVYDTRIYVRAWENGAGAATGNGQTSRSNTLVFSSGPDVGTVTVLEDNPSAATGVPGNPAFFINYHFMAGAPSLTIQALMNADPFGNSVGSFHLYAITNQSIAVPEPSSIILAALGLVGLAAWGWRRRKR